MYSPVSKNKKKTNVPQSALPLSRIHYKTSQNNRNNQNDLLMLKVYTFSVSTVAYFCRVTISWWVEIEPTSGHWKMFPFPILSYPILE